MLSYYFCCSLLAILIGETLFFSSAFGEPARDLIILTDMETDDRIALTIVAARPELSERLMFVGTTLLNTELKAELARKQLKDSGLDVPVYAGTGGPPSSYPNNVETAKAALKFWHEEGNGILSDEELKRFKEGFEREEIDPMIPDDITIARMNLIEDFWSVIIEQLPEPEAQKNTDYHQKDQENVTKLLNMLNIGMPPKYVYRMPKLSGQSSHQTAPRLLKAFFPSSLAVPLILTQWKKEELMQKIWTGGFPDLKIRSGLSSEEFIKAKRQFHRKLHHSRAANEEKEESEFFDANVELEAEEEEEEDNGIFHDTHEQFEESVADIHEEKEERSKMDPKEAASRLSELRWDVITKFLDHEEKERSVLIMDLPEQCVATENDKNAEQMPPPSDCYKWDFEAVMDILFSIGVEVSPVVVHRTGRYIPKRRGRYLQVIFRSTKVVECVLRSWDRLRWLIRNKKRSLWARLEIKEFEDYLPDPTGNLIENKEQLSDILRYLKDSPDQTNNRPKISGNDKYKQGHVYSGTMMANELQNELAKAFNEAKENSLDILLMTAPTDLVHVLYGTQEMAKKIRQVHLMGGWVELSAPSFLGQTHQMVNSQPLFYWRKGIKQEQSLPKVLPPPPPTIWGNYNLNMAPESSRRLFEMASEKGLFPLRLYTYRHVWEMFEGSVNKNSIFNVAIEAIKASPSLVLKEFLKAAKSWDEHAMKVMPYLTRFIGPYAGEQFSPADPILVVGLMKPSFITKSRKVKVNLKHDQLEMVNDVLEVKIEYDVESSKIELITGLHKPDFREALEHYFNRYCTKCNLLGHFVRPSCSDRARTKKKNKSKFCFRCGNHGHFVKECNEERRTPRERNQQDGNRQEFPQQGDAIREEIGSGSGGHGGNADQGRRYGRDGGLLGPGGGGSASRTNETVRILRRGEHYEAKQVEQGKQKAAAATADHFSGNKSGGEGTNQEIHQKFAPLNLKEPVMKGDKKELKDEIIEAKIQHNANILGENSVEPSDGSPPDFGAASEEQDGNRPPHRGGKSHRQGGTRILFGGGTSLGHSRFGSSGAIGSGCKQRQTRSGRRFTLDQDEFPSLGATERNKEN